VVGHLGANVDGCEKVHNGSGFGERNVEGGIVLGLQCYRHG